MSLEHAYNTFPSIHVSESNIYTTQDENKELIITYIDYYYFGRNSALEKIPWEEDKNFNLCRDKKINHLNVNIILHDLYADGKIVDNKVKIKKLYNHMKSFIKQNKISNESISGLFAELESEITRFKDYHLFFHQDNL
jgi:hypothetical protein